jgi:hypothetical protein
LPVVFDLAQLRHGTPDNPVARKSPILDNAAKAVILAILLRIGAAQKHAKQLFIADFREFRIAGHSCPRQHFELIGRCPSVMS